MRWLGRVIQSVGKVGIFGARVLIDAVQPPFEFAQVSRQLVEIGSKSIALIVVSGFALGAVMTLHTRNTLVTFGAGAIIPAVQALSFFVEIGPLVAGLLLAGRVGSGIGAVLANMRASEQIDAIESLSINSFKFLVVPRVLACVIVLPVLTLFMDFAGLLGGLLSETTDETVPQTITYNNVPNGYSPVGRTVVYNTAGGAFVELELNNSGAQLTQYLAMPSGTYQSGDYYDFLVSASDTTSGGTISVENYTSSAGPQSFTFPPPWSYAGPTAAALPTFKFAYSGFPGMSNISYQAAIYWDLGTWGFGIPADFDEISMSATANYQNGSTAMSIPDLSSLTGFLAIPPSGTTVRWSAGVYQGDPFLTSPPSGTIQGADNSGSYAEP